MATLSSTRASTAPATNWATIVADGSPIADVTGGASPRAVFCTVSGTATLVDNAGSSVLFNFVEGQVYPLRPVSVTSAAATLVALYGG